MSSKLRLVLKVAATLTVVGLGYLIRGHSGSEEHIGWAIAGWALTAYVVIRIALALRRGRAALKAQGDARVSIKSIERATMSAMPVWMQGWSRTEIKIYGGFWRALRGVPLARGPRFSVCDGARSGWLSAAAALAVASLAALGLVLLTGWSTSLKSLLIGVACIAGPALYLLVMLAGERRLLNEAGHAVTDDVLALAVGVRFTADIALADVVSCVPLTAADLVVEDACVVSPFERPNVLLTLRGDAVVGAERFGYAFKPGTPMLALYVDEPARFAGAVGAAVERQLPRYA
ncbi:hypothetical protein HHL21_00365 [Massilia sp. RP-1-19]|uniref:Uncharacterized protein n=1 Tax=Massilia polaris TaxID=2728846 RepID=A0A848HEN8_9BURK|nr:hypothetical protein [Massilia polaris]NML59567.1 hypothetical protein [Massilia polaris]